MYCIFSAEESAQLPSASLLVFVEYSTLHNFNSFSIESIRHLHKTCWVGGTVVWVAPARQEVGLRSILRKWIHQTWQDDTMKTGGHGCSFCRKQHTKLAIKLLLKVMTSRLVPPKCCQFNFINLRATNKMHCVCMCVFVCARARGAVPSFHAAIFAWLLSVTWSHTPASLLTGSFSSLK